MRKTTVVNKYHQLPFDMYIGRGTPWGNPFSHMEGTKANYKVETREEAVEAYREWIQTQPALLNRLYELKGKTLGCFCKPKACHGDVLAELADALPPRVLECSTKGDKRFSALYAKVNMWGKWDTIENHYQLCKRFGDVAPKNWRDAKGKTPTHIHLNGKDYDIHHLTAWYHMLWVRYLDCNPTLVEHAKGFDEYNDIFKGKNTVNSQADVICTYIEEGRESVWKNCEELWMLFQKKS